jgi:hypothetical protein
MWIRCCTVALLSAALTSGAAPANISGAWRLSLEKTVWGARPKPLDVLLHIQHNEPALAYSGVVTYSSEDGRQFSFSGAIDGKPYHMDRSFGGGTAVLRRIDAVAFESVFRTSDGASVETTRTTVTLDGKTLTRKIRLESRGVTSTSTEIYYRN